MKVLYRIIFLLVVIVSCLDISAINRGQMKFHSLSVNNGLSQHDITDIVEDSFGFIWVATYDGLNRYDGKKIQIFRHRTRDENSLSGNRIFSIMEDSKLRLWIGTNENGIDYYSLVDEKIVHIKTPRNCKTIYSFTEDKNGNIYVGTNNGLLQIDENKKEAVLLQLPVAGISIFEMVILNNHLYLSTDQGVWSYNGKQCNLVTVIPSNEYRHVVSDQKENIWFATRTGITKLTVTDTSVVVGPVDIDKTNMIRSLHYDESGKLLVGTELNGIYVYDADEMSLLEIINTQAGDPRSLKSNCITALLVDKQNTLWVGTNSAIHFANLEALNFHTFPSNNSIELMGFIYIGGKYIYVSGVNKSVCYRMEGDDFQLVQSNLPPMIKKVVPINGRNYIATINGLFVQKAPESHEYIPYKLSISFDPTRSNSYISLAVDNYGNKYIGTWRGLIIEKKNKVADWVDRWNPKADILRNESIYDIYHDNSNQCIWVGTVSNGLFRINLDASGEILTIQNYSITANNSFYIPCNQIWTIFRSSEGTLWLGTDAGLLRKNSTDESFYHIENSEILDKKIMSIQEDDNGNLWMGNTQGLIKYSPSSDVAQRFTYDDGLQSNTFTEASSKSAEGILFFGGLSGINWFKPAEIERNETPARIVFSGLIINNEYVHPHVEGSHKFLLDSAINLKSSITLNYDQNDIALEFMTIPFSGIQKYKIRYTLKGIDNDWINVSNENIISSYKNVPAGSYNFIVESFGPNGDGKIISRNIIIHIKPAPWATWWAYLFYILLLLAILFIIGFAVRRHNKLKQQVELDKSRLEQEEKMNEMKLMFFTDIAHEFKTPLSLIVGPVNDLAEEGFVDENQNFCFKVISRNVRRMMFLVNQLLDFRKITKGRYSLRVAQLDLAAFVRQVAKAFAWEAKNEQVNFNINAPEELTCWFDSGIIEKVLYNILSNAFRYTKTKGIVDLSVRSVWKNGRQIAEISVVDNGSGIDDDMKPHVFERFYHGTSRLSSGVGLHLSDQLIREHHGEINLTDSIYNGAEFIISFPVSADAYKENEFQQYIEEEKQAFFPDDLILEEKSPETTNLEQGDKLLIVEDDLDLRYYLKKCLESHYIIYEARNGAEGLKKTGQVVPDLIISDIMMPEMDGLEMIRKIKDDRALSHIPIILLTAKTDIEQQNEGLETGAFDYICKPFNTAILLNKIDNIFEQQNVYKKHILAENIVQDIGTKFTSYDCKLMDKLNTLIEENLDNSEMTIDFLAKELGISRMQLHRKVKTITGETSTSYVNMIKMRYARKMFDNGCDRVQDVMDAVGISSNSYLNKLFKSYYNETPSSYLLKRKANNGNSYH